MRRDGWQMLGQQTGPASKVAMLLWLAVAGAWLAWPVWSSANPPTRAEMAEVTPWVLAALASMLLVLGWTLWLEAGRRLSLLSPVVLFVGVAVGIRLLVNPSVPGVELVFAAPLLAGLVVGAPAGLLTGALACLVSAFTTGTVDTPLPGQMLVWGLWGVAGGLLHRAHAVVAWLLGTVACLPLGLASGMLLNLTGWATDESVQTGASVPGAGWLEQLGHLRDWTLASSVVVDLTRATTVALAMLVLGLPLLRALREARSPAPDPTGPDRDPEPLHPATIARRERSRGLQELWRPTDPRGDHP